MYRLHRKAQYHETDQMGVIHHANYIKWMEEARIAFLESLGYRYADIEREGIGSAVVGVSAEYRQPVRFGDEVTVDVRITTYNGVRLVFSYEVRQAQSGALCMTGETRHCFLKDGRVVRIDRLLPGADEALKNAAEQE
jgi:acyl-CoA thioester hydrolase, YbgC/YbaW family